MVDAHAIALGEDFVMCEWITSNPSVFHTCRATLHIRSVGIH